VKSMKTLCEWVQLRMTEYVRKEPAVPRHERDKIEPMPSVTTYCTCTLHAGGCSPE
jgi:hypothetical protein